MKLNRRKLRRLIESVILEQSEGVEGYGPDFNGEDIIVGAGEEYKFTADSGSYDSAGLLIYVKEGDHKKVALKGKGLQVQIGKGTSKRVKLAKDLHVTDDEKEIFVELIDGSEHFTLKNSGSQPVKVDIVILYEGGGEYSKESGYSVPPDPSSNPTLYGGNERVRRDIFGGGVETHDIDMGRTNPRKK